MKNQQLKFLNRQFKQAIIVICIMPFLLLAIHLLMPEGFWGALIAVMFYIPFMLATHPKQYVLKDDSLVLNFLIRKNEVIAIEDIATIEVSAIKWMIIKYNKNGFVTSSSIKVIISEFDLRILQEELMRRNPKIEIVYK